MRNAALATALLLLTAAAAAPEETPLAQYQRLRQEAAAAAQAGHLATAEAKMEGALAIVPTSPGTLIRLARIENAAGKTNEALAHLTAFALLGLTWDVESDGGLKSLTALPAYAPIGERLARNGQPVGKLEVVQTLPAGSGIYEGLYFAESGWLLSSVTDHTILKLAGGKLTPFLKDEAPAGGLFGLAGQSRQLWATEASGPGIPGSTAPAQTGLVKIDPGTGKVLARYLVPKDGKDHQLGDAVVGFDGTVYVSDARSGEIWRLKPKAQQLELFVAAGQLGSPQGLETCGKDALVVADYTTGLHRLDLKIGRLEAIGGAPVALAGTDGLFGVSFDVQDPPKINPVSYVVTQNGVSPQRLVLLDLDPNCRRIMGSQVLAANHPQMQDLTLGAVVGDNVYFIGNSGWAAFDGEGKRDPAAGPTTTQILKVRLPQR